MTKTKTFIIIILLGISSHLPALAKEYDSSAEALFSYGEALLKQERYSDAKQEFEKCLMLNPQHEQAKIYLQLCAQELGSEKDKAMLLALEKAEKKIDSQPEITTLSPPIQKGAWTLKKGEIYAELYTKYYWHNHEFNDDEKKERWAYEGKGNEIRTELKLEYGFNEELNLLLYTVAKEAHWKDSFKSCTKKGFVEMWPGVKYCLFKEPFICTLQGRVKFPFDYSEEAVPALGTHQIDGELKVLTAQPWPKLPGYTKFEFGFRARNEEPVNEIPYFFEFGYNLSPQLILKTTLDCNEGLAQTGGVDEDWMKYTVGPIFKIKDILNIEFGFGHTFYGKNTSAAKEVICSLSRQW